MAAPNAVFTPRTKTSSLSGSSFVTFSPLDRVCLRSPKRSEGWSTDFRVDEAFFFGGSVKAKFDQSRGSHSGGGGEVNAIMGAIFDNFEEVWQKYDSLR